MVTVALDGRGVEQGLDVLAEGARRAMADGIALRIFGDSKELKALRDEGAKVIEAPGEISNEDDPVASVRSREDASIVMAAADVADGYSRGPGQRRPDRCDDDGGAVRAQAPQRRSPPVPGGAASRGRSRRAPDAAPRRRRQLRGALSGPRPVGRDGRRLLPRRSRRRRPARRPAFGRRGVEEGHARGRRGARRARGTRRDQLHREHRGPRPALGSGRGDRDRRLHRQCRVEDARRAPRRRLDRPSARPHARIPSRPWAG